MLTGFPSFTSSELTLTSMIFAFAGPSGDALPLLFEVMVLALFSVPALALAVRWFGQQE